VVCGTTVTRARSSSALGTPSTRQGRIFAARPRSTSQTSPRRGNLTPGPLDGRTLGTLGQRLVPALRQWAKNTECSSVAAIAGQGLRASRPREAPRMNRSVVLRRSSCRHYTLTPTGPNAGHQRRAGISYKARWRCSARPLHGIGLLHSTSSSFTPRPARTLALAFSMRSRKRGSFSSR
jgi:hypothetical protein